MAAMAAILKNLVGSIRVTCRSKIAKIFPIGNPRWPPYHGGHLENLFFSSSPSACRTWDFLILISGSPGNQIVSFSSKHLTSIFLMPHLWSKTAIFKLNNVQILSKFFL